MEEHNTSTVATSTCIVRHVRPAIRSVEADVCVVGSGAAGLSAALESARMGRRTILVDSLPVLGGQAVNSIIGTFCGLFSNGSHGYQFTHGIADQILADLGKEPDALHYQRGPMTTVVYYDEVALSHWVDRTIRASGTTVLLNAVIDRVLVEGRRIRSVEFATRWGRVRVDATGWIDATGDAALVWQAGWACREPANGPVFGTQMVVLENIDEAHQPTREKLSARLAALAGDYGLVRREGLAFVIPGRCIAAMNMTHVETPLDPLAASAATLEGRDQANRAVRFLREQFPRCFGAARVRAYGFPGIRQTRWIVGRQQLTLADVRAGTRFPDAVARTAWPVELHDHGSGHVWQTFAEDHVHYVPLGSLLPEEADNVAAAGRCIDADAAALSSVRVMGPCMATGAAAAHALDLAGTGSVHQIDINELARRVRDNVERTD
ncbi:FAD-dependent oxidoreductase [Xanthobacteraceae bacterium Astr-EGSB]|uniref:FAD-dependent oxidoreductase n=1 Tax=Astrobacterium formosum TaxID=3069710 RepID=UPI0027B4A1C8|nr:FAD-dependent oxidoreductase [Xanthobacteraceae bacterium Astr-EGSB]